MVVDLSISKLWIVEIRYTLYDIIMIDFGFCDSAVQKYIIVSP